MKIFIYIAILLSGLLTFVNAQTGYTAGSYNYEYTYGPASYDTSYGSYNYGQTSHDDDVVVGEVVGTSDPDERDAVRAGIGYAQVMWHEYVIDITYLGKDNEWHYMLLDANLKGQITSVTLDDKVILKKGEAVLPGIPMPEGGMRYAYVYVDGVIDDEPKVNGSAYYERLKNGDRVSVLLRPLKNVKFIPANLSSFPAIPDDVDPFDIRLVDENGNWVGYYYPWLGGFVLYQDPTANPFYASIYIQGYTGNFGSFLVDPLKQQTKKFQGASMDFSLLGGVVRIVEPSYESYKLDGQTTYDGGTTPRQAKSFIYHNERGEDVGFSFWAKPIVKSGWIKIDVYSVSGSDHEKVFTKTIFPKQYYEGFEYDEYFNLPCASEGWEDLVFVVQVQAGGVVDDKIQFGLFPQGSGKG